MNRAFDPPRNECKKLLLIGTVHGDPDGMVRLLRLLRKEKPSLIALEVSPYGLFYRKRYSRRLRGRMIRGLRRLAARHNVSWKDGGQVQAILRQLDLPFEYVAALRFCRDSGAVLHCLDLSDLSRQLIQPRWEELLDVRNLETLLTMPSEDHRVSVRKAYALASRLLREKDKAYLSAFVGDLEADLGRQGRESYLAGEIERRHTLLGGGKIAYVGGWRHLLSPTRAGTLTDRLAHLCPRRLLLTDPLQCGKIYTGTVANGQHPAEKRVEVSSAST